MGQDSVVKNMEAEDEGRKVTHHVSQTVTAVMCMRPTVGKRCDGRKTLVLINMHSGKDECRLMKVGLTGCSVTEEG